MKANRILLFVLSVILISFACSRGKAENNFQLVWSDEFDYSGLPDPDKWNYDTEGNDEAFPQVMELEYVRVFQKRNVWTAKKSTWETAK